MVHIDLKKVTLNKTVVFIQHERGAKLGVKLTDNGTPITVDDLVLVASNETERIRLQAEGENGLYTIVVDELCKHSGTMLCQLTFKYGEQRGVSGTFNVFITPNNVKYEPIVPAEAYFKLGVVGHGIAGLSVVGNVLEID